MKKRIVSILLIFLLFMQFMFPIISFGSYTKYVSLGDSIPTGYGLENPVSDNYTEKLRQKLNISLDNYENLSVSAETTMKFYNTIQTTKYTESIKNADLITITLRV